MAVRAAEWAAAGLGFFTVGAQTALLREYLVPFGGGELAFGTFFCCWFAWIALGALGLRRLPGLPEMLLARATTLVLLHPLGGLLGLWTIPLTRLISGLQAFEPMPPGLLLLAAGLATAPVGLGTGLLFPALCEKTASTSRTGASIGYLWEGMGAVAGGLLALGAVRLGLGGSGVLALAGLPPAVIGLWDAWKRRHRGFLAAGLVVLGLLLATLVPGGPVQTGFHRTRLKASLPQGTWVQDLESPYQPLTLAGIPGQTVLLASGEMAAVFPPDPGDEGPAAVLASLSPRQDRAVVLGEGGLPLALSLTRYFRDVVCVLRDGAFWEVFREAWEASGAPREPLTRLRVEVSDPRLWAREAAGPGGTAPLDLAVVAAGEPSTLQAGRLYTVEAFRDLAAGLGPGAVVAVPIRSGEQHLGPEVLRYGQSLWRTLSEVFPSLGVVPGERALLLASDRPVSLDPEELLRRYRAFAPSPPPFPPDALRGLLPPDRVALARDLYGQAEVPSDLVHRDDRPLASLLHLVSRLRETNSPLGSLLWDLHGTPAPWLIGLLGILAWAVLRERLRRGPSEADFTAFFVLGVGGGVSIASYTLLLTAYQARFGAVFGEVGALAALSMSGMVAGALLAHRWLRDRTGDPVRRRGIALCLAQAAFLALVPSLLGLMGNSRPALGGLFLATGAGSGLSWPLAAAITQGERVAVRLQVADHLGAMTLSGLVGVFCMAVFGTDVTFWVLSGLLTLAALLLGLEGLVGRTAVAIARSRPSRTTRLLRSLSAPSFPWRLGPMLATLLALSALLIWHASRRPDPALSPRLSAEALRRLETFTAASLSETPFPHHRLEGLEGPVGKAVAAASQAIAPEVRGYGGPLNLALSVGEDGRLRNAIVLSHRETPSYARGLADLLRALVGRDAREALTGSDLREIDAMTGATVTREAVLTALDRTRAALAGQVLGLSTQDPPRAPWWWPLANPRLAFVAASLLAAVWVHLRGGARERLALLSLSLLLGGMVFNLQLSASWVLMLARGHWPSWDTHAALWLLTVGVLVLTVLFGPVYCAHLCPFGALQEMVSRVASRLGWTGRPPRSLSLVARSLKYGVLVLVILSLLDRNPESRLAFDPLAAVFSGDLGGPGTWLALLALVGSLLAFRFWCRVFCPVGALLNLGNRPAGWWGLAPPRVHRACDLDVQGPYDLECLQCNRCLREAQYPEANPPSDAREAP